MQSEAVKSLLEIMSDIFSGLADFSDSSGQRLSDDPKDSCDPHDFDCRASRLRVLSCVEDVSGERDGKTARAAAVVKLMVVKKEKLEIEAGKKKAMVFFGT